MCHASGVCLGVILFLFIKRHEITAFVDQKCLINQQFYMIQANIWVKYNCCNSIWWQDKEGPQYSKYI